MLVVFLALLQICKALRQYDDTNIRAQDAAALTVFHDSADVFEDLSEITQEFFHPLYSFACSGGSECRGSDIAEWRHHGRLDWIVHTSSFCKK